MSALPPKADLVQRDRDVRFVPKADIQTAIFPLRNAPHTLSISTFVGTIVRFSRMRRSGLGR